MLGQSSDCRIVLQGQRKLCDREIGDRSGSGKAAGEGRREEKGSQRSKGDEVDQFLLEKPVHHRPRRLADSINLTGAVPAPLGRAGIVSRRLCLRESCMRENRTYSLSGGRWPARKRATSDPTPMKGSNKEGQPTAESLEGRPGTKENVRQLNMRPTQSGERVSQRLPGVRRVRRYLSKVRAVCGKSARTDPCGGCWATGIPTATRMPSLPQVRAVAGGDREFPRNWVCFFLVVSDPAGR
jgi:hypothetical protein